jgi:hypothetical protein
MNYEIISEFINKEVFIDILRWRNKFFINTKQKDLYVSFDAKSKLQVYHIEQPTNTYADYKPITKTFILTETLAELLISDSELFKTLIFEEYKL